jgi:hypothetical protein
MQRKIGHVNIPLFNKKQRFLSKVSFTNLIWHNAFTVYKLDENTAQNRTCKCTFTTEKTKTSE